MDPDCVEIPPPIHQKPSRFKKQKQQTIFHDVVDLEGDDDLVVLGETYRKSKRNKGKAVETNHGGYGDLQVVPSFGKSGIQSSNGQPSLSHNLINVGSQGSNAPHEHVHPQGLESRNPWLKGSYNFNAPQEHAHPQGLESRNPWLKGSYNFNFNAPHAHPQGLESRNPWLKSSYNVNAPHEHAHPQGLEYSNPLLKSSYNFSAPHVHTHPWGLESSNPWLKSSYKFKAPPEHAHPQGLESRNLWLKSSYNFNAPPEHAHPQGLESQNLLLQSSYNFNIPPEHTHPQGLESKTPWLKSSYNFNAPPEQAHIGASVVPPCLTTITDEPENETLRKLRSFKQFDTVVDTSDHYFVKNNSSMNQNPKNWVKKIQDEWRILEKHLPDTIFVRVFESRMDLLRAVIIGAAGTPYHDGLFFFDVFFPSGYPSVPPQVHYHAGGLRLNPNLYACGKVCLSLLNTWSGQTNEMWTPGVSTMLQVLVSIQGLILNAKPYFNEPGVVSFGGTQIGEAQSLNYNEITFILSVRTMMYTIKRPPKNFEDLVVGHFYSRAHDILASCKAYMEGVQVGCFVKDGVQDVDKGGRKSSAIFKADLFGSVQLPLNPYQYFVKNFKADLLGCVKLLVQDFEKIGVKDCQKFMSMTSPIPCSTGGRFA